ncbi:tripartite tricarboxylate transporter substrate binding protein [Bradyrhizobium sp. LHD-71]|uniref:Bug family tripartite tricarboxylate transporter substrate binding protein n=1 Tax=Bradyrhizobium sp. LHD-71 TaxID=3072141 RepID=UPI00281031CF|nr:tripartite tricarboxylate transporter substrate binding protein [Bradyrhizobium sp. LHD-71]MDQ8732502.1 tripartite tricarboxylate transporter substrate binding protein [Bradyrhizobium sp. LHD-71]
MTTRRTFTKAVALSPLVLSSFPGAFAQGKYPTKQIQMVVGFPPGQSSDIGARLIAKQMSDVLKQTVFVENKPGAATIIGHQYLKAAAPDGYTIGYSSTGPLAINPTLYKKLPYDPQADFEPIILLNFSPMFLVTHKNMPVNTYKEAIAYIKANPGKVEYGSGGSGLTVHITTELLKKEAGVDMLHVPYKGAAPMITDLIAGRVQFAFEVASAILPFAQSGEVKLLGVASLTRSPAAPQVPTLHEQGLTGFESSTWGVLLAPKGTPKDIINVLNEAANLGLKTKESMDHYAKNGAEVKGGTPEECGAFMKREREKWAPVILASGAQVD